MSLPSAYRFQGWTIRYNMLESKDGQTSSCAKERQSVVFVHGTPWSSAVFQPVVDALLATKHIRILLYDLPGYGQSQDFKDPDESSTIANTARVCFAGDTSVQFQACALQALLAHVEMDGGKGCPAPAVIAHDIAGAIVLRAHLMLGCEYESMMLCDTNAVLPWGDGFYKLARAEPRIFMDLPPKIFEAVVRAVIRSARCGPSTSQDAWEDKLALPWLSQAEESPGIATEERQRSFVRQIAQANDQDVAEMLEENLYSHVRCGVKIVWGEQDQWIPREKVDDLRRRIGDRVRKVALIPDAGHLLMLDQPERFAIEVFAWLRGDT